MPRRWPLERRRRRLRRLRGETTIPLAPVSRLFFFQAEDGIRDLIVTGVQTCALPIYESSVIGKANLRQMQGDSSARRRARDLQESEAQAAPRLRGKENHGTHCRCG